MPKALRKQKPVTNQKRRVLRPSNDDAPVTKGKAGPFLKTTRRFFTKILGDYSLAHEHFLGVDITPHYIRLCQMESGRKKSVLTNLASSCIESNFVLDDIFSNPTIYIENLRGLVEKHSLQNKEVALSIPVSGAIIRTLTVDDMNEEELRKPETIKTLWHVSLAMDIDSSEYAIGIHVLSRGMQVPDKSGKTKKMMEVLLVAVRQSILTIFTHITRSAGLVPVIAVLRCFALENALEGLRKGGTSVRNEAFLEFGADENYLFIPNPDGVGAHQIYLAAPERQSLATHTADSGTVTALAKSYAEQIQRIITTHEREHPEDKILRIYVTSSLPLHVKKPGEAPIITAFVAELSGLLPHYKVSECIFCDRAEVSEQFADTVNAEGKLSAWAVTMGLASTRLDAFDALKHSAKISNMNMLPEAPQFKKAERVKVISRADALAALVSVMVVSVLVFGFLFTQSKRLESAMAPLLQVEQEYKAQMEKLDKLRSVTEKLHSLDTVRAELSSNQGVLLAAYNYLGKTIPDGIWLREITFQAPKTLAIVGNSTDDQSILEFIRLLNESGKFRQVSLKTMQSVKELNANTTEALAVKKFELGGEFLSTENEVKP